jgi:hypothetical protein
MLADKSMVSTYNARKCFHDFLKVILTGFPRTFRLSDGKVRSTMAAMVIVICISTRNYNYKRDCNESNELASAIRHAN